MSVHQISCSTRYSYQKINSVDNNTRTVWFIFHGYGQLAREFLPQFKPLLNETTCLVAPQGLSLFYLKGFSGKVGASWLAHEERDNGIDNYISYLNAIYDKEVGNYETAISINLLGFSQGSATASRWAIRAGIPFDKLVLWGGFFAHEIGKDLASKHLKDRDLYLVYGDHDHLVTPNVQRNMKRKCRVLGIEPSFISYPGGHEILPGPLKEIVNAE
jgi:predicted esterase